MCGSLLPPQIAWQLDEVGQRGGFSFAVGTGSGGDWLGLGDVSGFSKIECEGSGS